MNGVVKRSWMRPNWDGRGDAGGYFTGTPVSVVMCFTRVPERTANLQDVTTKWAPFHHGKRLSSTTEGREQRVFTLCSDYHYWLWISVFGHLEAASATMMRISIADISAGIDFVEWYSLSVPLS